MKAVNNKIDHTGDIIVGANPIVKDADFTAENGAKYRTTDDCISTDPTGVEGRGYEVEVLAGTATIGGVGYSIVGTIIHRYYQGGAWTSNIYQSGSTFDPAVDTISSVTPVNVAIAAGDTINEFASKAQGQIAAVLANAGVALQAETISYLQELGVDGSIVDASSIYGIDTFFVTGKIDGWLTKLLWFWSPIGSNLAGALVNMHITAGVNRRLTNNNFVAGDYSQKGGFGTGSVVNTNKHLGTGFNPAALGLATQAMSMGHYVVDESGFGDSAYMYGIAPASGASPIYGSCVRYQCVISPCQEFAQPPACVAVSTNGAAAYNADMNGVPTRVATSAVAIPVGVLTTEFTIGKAKNGASSAYSRFKLGAVWLGLPMTSAELTSLNKAIIALQSAIGRRRISGGVLLGTGDSNTQAIKATARKKSWTFLLSQYTGLKELNTGKDGAMLRGPRTTAASQFNGLLGLADKYLKINEVDANLVTYLWGTNDVLQDTNPAGDTTIIADLKTKYITYVQSALDLGRRVVMINLMPIGTQTNAKVSLYNTAIKEVAVTCNVPMLDLFNILVDEPSYFATYYDIDQIHLDDDGNLLLAQSLIALLQGRITRNPTLVFGTIAAGATVDVTTTITMARQNMAVSLGLPSTIDAGIRATAFVSADDTVTVRMTNTTLVDIVVADSRYHITVFQDKIN